MNTKTLLLLLVVFVVIDATVAKKGGGGGGGGKKCKGKKKALCQQLDNCNADKADLQSNVETLQGENDKLEEENDQLKEELKETIYIMADPAENCNARCEKHHLKCVEQGAFPGGVAADIFAQLGLPCKTESAFLYTDQPCYVPSTGHCYGTTKIPENNNCAEGHNGAVRRLCPCTRA